DLLDEDEVKMMKDKCGRDVEGMRRLVKGYDIGMMSTDFEKYFDRIEEVEMMCLDGEIYVCESFEDCVKILSEMRIVNNGRLYNVRDLYSKHDKYLVYVKMFLN